MDMIIIYVNYVVVDEGLIYFILIISFGIYVRLWRVDYCVELGIGYD